MGRYSVDPHAHSGPGDGGSIQQITDPYTDEKARDAIAAALTEGGNVTIEVDDENDTITISSSGQTEASIEDDGSDLSSHENDSDSDFDLVSISGQAGVLLGGVVFEAGVTSASIGITVDGGAEFNVPYHEASFMPAFGVGEAIAYLPTIRFDNSITVAIDVGSHAGGIAWTKS